MSDQKDHEIALLKERVKKFQHEKERLAEDLNRLQQDMAEEVADLKEQLEKEKAKSISLVSQVEDLKNQLHSTKLHLESVESDATALRKRVSSLGPIPYILELIVECEKKTPASLQHDRFRTQDETSFQLDPSKVSDLGAMSATIETMATTLLTFQVFKTFLDASSCSENLEFYMSVSAYKSIQSNEDLVTTAQSIFDRYIKNGAPREINISGKVKRGTIERLETPTHTTFDLSSKEIFELMRTDSYRSFVSSGLYRWFSAQMTSLFEDARKKAKEQGAHAAEMLELETDQMAMIEKQKKKYRQKFNISDDDDAIQFVCRAMYERKGAPVNGKILLTSHYFLFAGRLLGVSAKEVLVLQNIASYQRVDDHTFMISEKGEGEGERELVFSKIANVDQLVEHFGIAWDHAKRKAKETVQAREVSATEIDTTELGENDWQLIIGGAKTIKLNQDDVVISEGKKTHSMYRIRIGTLRAEKINESGEKIVLTRMHEGQVFGEMSFLEEGKASASVVADEDGVEVYIIDRFFIESLLSVEPGLPARFYRHLAKELARRLRFRDEESRKAAQQTASSREFESEICSLESRMNQIEEMLNKLPPLAS
eukprot:Rmarinus@m.12120